ncbi:DUF3618 domain-containing protein [Aestuariivita sp.]|jgi:hypothetical protein|uniref:DUF3618 domain-containing protein n=1 Tax=Aestuariivita sp. TaxID=1872407 RepID=UPI00217378F3|nr:DUF3618 domain-containing protein [Aestuariivita sp.]MCE8005789.1 DUF3618 domain-containing protein [Aestuariivita sp.]
MTNETRSPKEIEREIEEQRSDLTSNLEDLQDKFSIDTVVRQIGDQFREHGGDMGRSISNQVKANPIPLALTGIGLAWMMFGNGAQKQSAQTPISDHRDDDRYSEVENDFRRTRERQGRPYVAPTSYAPARNDGPSWSRDDADNGPPLKDHASSSAAAMKDGASSAAASVSDAARSVGSSVSDAANAAGSKVSDAAASAKSSVTGAAQTARDGIATAASRIAEGTETLSEEGRKRVIAARQKALDLRRQTARAAQEGADAAADFYDRQPLVVGALALAVGAALGGALPRTKAEDDLMGSQSDDLIDQAERIFEEEKAKAMSVAKSVKDEATDIASEAKADLDSGAPGDKTAVEAIGDKAKSVAGRVADTASSAAKDEKLGKPKT